MYERVGKWENTWNDDTTLDQTVRKYRNLMTILGRTDWMNWVSRNVMIRRGSYVLSSFQGAVQLPRSNFYIARSHGKSQVRVVSVVVYYYVMLYMLDCWLLGWHETSCWYYPGAALPSCFYAISQDDSCLRRCPSRWRGGPVMRSRRSPKFNQVSNALLGKGFDHAGRAMIWSARP